MKIKYEQSFKEMLQSADSKKYLILMAEGGFAPEEVQLCKDAGFKVYDKTILRAETASIRLSSCIKKGDLGGIY